MKIHLVSGFLGSGKTTAVRTAARVFMQSGIKTGVITNDQGIRLVDGGYLEAEGIPGRQVMNGCFCCNYGDLDRQIDSLMKDSLPDLIFAESVGSCTDIVATVLRPLIAFRPQTRVTLSVVCDSLLLKMLLLDEQPLFGPEVEYIFWKQVEEASLVLLNKTDLLAEADAERLRAAMEKKFRGRTTIPLVAGDGLSVGRWLRALDSFDPRQVSDAGVNYDVYAAGEAMMGWLDRDLEIRTTAPASVAAATMLVKKLSRSLQESGYPVGHVKWLIDEKKKISLTALSGPPTFPDMPESMTLRLLLNARVQVHPDLLTALIDAAITATEKESGAQISTRSHAAFQPGYPRPQHRLV